MTAEIETAQVPERYASVTFRSLDVGFGQRIVGSQNVFSRRQCKQTVVIVFFRAVTVCRTAVSSVISAVAVSISAGVAVAVGFVVAGITAILPGVAVAVGRPNRHCRPTKNG